MKINIQLFASWDDLKTQYDENIKTTQDQLTGLGAEKDSALNDYDKNYQDQINNYDKLLGDQQSALDEAQKTQEETQQKQTDYNIGLINQEKEDAAKKTEDEVRNSYVDWMKQNNSSGGALENLASSGLSTQGFSESSKIAMYNTYQNRVGTANAALVKANTEFSNQIQQALLNHDATLAELAIQYASQKNQLALQGFEYKNTLYNNKLSYEQSIKDNYFNQTQTLQNRIDSYKNSISEINQYQEQQEIARQQREEEKLRYEQERELENKKFQESITQFNAQLTLDKNKLAEEQRQFDALNSINEFDDKEKDTAVKAAYSPSLSTRYAQNWLENNITKKAIANKGISSSELEKTLTTAYNAGTINKNDVAKILKSYGLE